MIYKKYVPPLSPPFPSPPQLTNPFLLSPPPISLSPPPSSSSSQYRPQSFHESRLWSCGYESRSRKKVCCKKRRNTKKNSLCSTSQTSPWPQEDRRRRLRLFFSFLNPWEILFPRCFCPCRSKETPPHFLCCVFFSFFEAYPQAQPTFLLFPLSGPLSFCLPLPCPFHSLSFLLSFSFSSLLLSRSLFSSCFLSPQIYPCPFSLSFFFLCSF